VTVAKFVVVCRHLPGETEEKHKNIRIIGVLTDIWISTA